MAATAEKKNGVHYTPPALASVVAEKLAGCLDSRRGSLRILDPACGDGNLLLAIARALRPALLRRSTLVGIEQDRDGFTSARLRLKDLACATELLQGDFLESDADGDLFRGDCAIEPVDAIIANPPYVRTQVLGAARARELAARYQLSGRVDLYQAFLIAMARKLKPGGLLGVIMSNRFLSTRAGAATRGCLRSHFQILEIVDLGDTKLFDAAVLPALVFAQKKGTGDDAVEAQSSREAKFVRIYEDVSPLPVDSRQASSVLELVRRPTTGVFRVNGTAYHVATGALKPPEGDDAPWAMMTTRERNWVETVRSSASCFVKDVARIRVGVKTTADAVFIRRDWQGLPLDVRPESRFLRSLLSQDIAARWTPLQTETQPRRVLYTHEVSEGRRRAIKFDERSRAWRYLLANRPRLENRAYLIEAGRQWYEIWVPQDPEAWKYPKIVFPDISPQARFFLDRNGAVVDGNCYWITPKNPDLESLLHLILGVANSSVMHRYHDLAFPNKLYSQRRRYLTQYVAEYPLPDPNSKYAESIACLARRLVEEADTGNRQHLEAALDQQVAAAFGVEVPTSGHVG